MTHDNGMDVSPSWQELKERCEALEANVERIKSLKNAFGTPLSKTVPALGAILDETPTTYLARLKAEWQA